MKKRSSQAYFCMDKDAVFITLGDGRKGNVRFAGTANIVSAMEHSGVRRLICQTTLGVGESVSNLDFFWRYMMFGWFLKKAFQDHIQQERIATESRLDWTIVRPAAFTDGPLTGHYRHGFPALIKPDLEKFPAWMSPIFSWTN